MPSLSPLTLVCLAGILLAVALLAVVSLQRADRDRLTSLESKLRGLAE